MTQAMVARRAPNPEFTPGLPPLDAADILTLAEAAKTVQMAIPTLRKAIREGKLAAWIPRGVVDPLRGGPGQGYRIYKADLQRWYFGA